MNQDSYFYSRSILTKEFYRLGGELFANLMTQHRKEKGMLTKEEDTSVFFNKIMGMQDPLEEKESQFIEIANALQILKDQKAPTGKPNLKVVHE